MTTDTASILTKEEKEILQEGTRLIKQLHSEINKEPEAIPKFCLESLELAETPMGGCFQKLTALVHKANKYYQRLKGLMDSKDPTHRLLTRMALELAGRAGDADPDAVMAASTEPDRNKKMMALVMEGHFYGAVGGGRQGNYLQRIITSEHLFKFLDHIEDIEENAVVNFGRHLLESRKAGDARELGLALHYIQDLTAPHHVTNRAFLFETVTDGTDSHFTFEKYANLQVGDNYDTLKNASERLVADVSLHYDPQSPQAFAEWVQSRALTQAHWVDHDKLDDWQKAIDANIPLAVAASTVIIQGQ